MNALDPEGEEEEKVSQDWENFALMSYERFYDKMKVNLPTTAVLGRIIARILIELAENNRSKDTEHTVYHTNSHPPLTLPDYMDRITRYSCCSSEAFVVSLMYIDKLQKERPEVCLKHSNVHK